MDELLTISQKIINVLKETHATNKDLSEFLDTDENYIRVVMNRMISHGVVIHTGRFINRYKLYRLAREDEVSQNKDSELYLKILVKMILPFAKSGISVDLLPEEQEKIRGLFETNYDDTGEKKDG